MSAPAETVIDNAAWPGAEPRLSVLTPFFRDDPRPLLAALDREASGLNGEIEIVLLDDCGGDLDLSQQVATEVGAVMCPVRLVQLSANAGRSGGRNRLAVHARARHLLFLDSDMLPDSPDFLAAYLDLIEREDPAVAVGGFSVEQASRAPAGALHRAMSAGSDCLPAAVRRRAPEKHVFTSNLLVRRDVFEAEAFDEAFSGWGWEDVEWGVRVAARYGVSHIDNPATHLGLDPAPMLASKYEQSAANFARLYARHPEVVSTYPSFRAARVLKRAPARGVWRPMLKALALADHAPMPARVAAMKLYRAALYAEVV